MFNIKNRLILIENLLLGIVSVKPLRDLDNDFSVMCIYCGKVFKISKDQLGDTIKCNSCEKKLKIDDFAHDLITIGEDSPENHKITENRINELVNDVATDYEEIFMPFPEELPIYRKQRLNRDPIAISFLDKFRQFYNFTRLIKNLGRLSIITGIGLLPLWHSYINIVFGLITFAIAIFSYILKIKAIEELDYNFFNYLSLIMISIFIIGCLNWGLINHLNINITIISYAISIITIIIGTICIICGRDLERF